MRILLAWFTVPELRFGQLISNALALSGKECFYIEDDDLVDVVEAYVSKQPL